MEEEESDIYKDGNTLREFGDRIKSAVLLISFDME